MSLTPDNLSVMTDNFALPTTAPSHPVSPSSSDPANAPTAAYQTPPTEAELASMIEGTLIERMGIAITEFGAERTCASMPVAGNTQPAGLLHGGASAALAETVGSFAASAHAGPGRAVVGLEINATHHRAVRDGHVHALATALHLGRTMASYEIVISDDEGRRVCTARLSCMILAGK